MNAHRPAGTVAVWDPWLRVAHWTLLAGFAFEWITEDALLGPHVVVGYALAAVVAWRVIWGFVGPRRARFADFVHGPRAVAAYLVALARGRAPRHLGHSPAGGAMIVALLFAIAATALSGVAVYAAEEGSGPFAGALAHASPGTTQALGDIHQALAMVTLGLAALHLLGVAVASRAHGENLAKAMITGRKPLVPATGRGEGRRA